MIELGTMQIRDEEAPVQIRVKVLGLLVSLGADEVLATRVATAASELSHRYQLLGAESRCRCVLHNEYSSLLVEFRFTSAHPHPETTDLEGIAGVMRMGRNGTGTDELVVQIKLPMPRDGLSKRAIARGRERILQRSRRELMDELRAKNAELEAYNETLEETVAERTRELTHANEQMARDLSAGSEYVQGLIPDPIEEPVRVDWRYIPSSSLGGDTIGYHWIDDDHLALYLIDVTGHGLDSALLAVTVMNVLRAGSLAGVDMVDPDRVLFALNNSFQAHHHGMKFFTIWYGVYQPSTRELVWSGGGHHPSILISPGTEAPAMLEATGPLIGAVEDMDFPAERCTVAPGSRMAIFSDGVFEIIRDNDLVWTWEGLVEFVDTLRGAKVPLADALLQEAERIKGDASFDDDVSIIEAVFP